MPSLRSLKRARAHEPRVDPGRSSRSGARTSISERDSRSSLPATAEHTSVWLIIRAPTRIIDGVSLEDRVKALEEQQRVLETLYAYSHSIDRGDEEGWLECFTDDAVFEVRSQIPDYPIQRHQGTDALGAFIASHTKPPEVQHKHLYVDPQITVDGNRAGAVGYFVHLLDRDHKPAVVSYGRYLDKLVRAEDGRWRFVERVSEVHASENSAAASFSRPPRISP